MSTDPDSLAGLVSRLAEKITAGESLGESSQGDLLAAVAKLCANNGPLRDQLLEQINSIRVESKAPATTLTAAALTDIFASALDAETDENPGASIGPYRLLQEIGRGGFGVVWMAEQTEPVRRRVALKVIKRGMDTDEVISRFEAERQALAMMDHPNIARVFDAGSTDAGRPYFVMELVRGIAITRYCDDNRLSSEARLHLFICVCKAVQHAHQKGVIHRDLKPSNILVTLHDGVPVPKVIDFGIAKATQGRLTEKTLFTQFHAFMGTPAYTSPEQMEMSGLDVDTRSDIYSLGVLLYELLTGSPPFTSDELVKSGLDAMRRTIREVDPPRPSMRLSTLSSADRHSVALQRGTDPAKLSVMLHGDLDWVVMHCLEKDRTRRYGTANGLAEDVRRHLENKPVTARPPTATYLFGKAIRRNRLVFIAGAAVTLALAAALAFSTWSYLRERAANRRTQTARAQAEKLINLLLQDVRPSLEQFGRVPVLDRFAEETARYYADLPEELRDESYAANRAITLGILTWVHYRRADFATTMKIGREATIWRQRVLENSPEEFRRIASLLVIPVDFSSTPGAVKEENVRRLRSILAAHPDDVYLVKELAYELGALGAWRDSETDSHAGIGELSEAAELLKRATVRVPEDIFLRIGYSNLLQNLSWSFRQASRYEDAIDATARAVQTLETAYAASPGNLLLLAELAHSRRSHSHTLASVSLLRARDAERTARADFQTLLRLDPSRGEAREMANFCHMLEAWHLLHNGNFGDARRLFSEIAERYKAAQSWGFNTTDLIPWLHVDQCEAAAAAGELDEARNQVEQARTLFEARIAATADDDRDNQLIQMHTALATAFTWMRDWPRAQTHAGNAQMLADKLARESHNDSLHRVERGLARSLVGQAQLRQGQVPEAISTLREAVAQLEISSAPAHPFGTRDDWLAHARILLAEALTEQRNTEAARSLIDEALVFRELDLTRQPDLAFARAEFARAVVVFASATNPADPAQVQRRNALVNRAAEIIAPLTAEGRLTPEQRQVAEKISALRAALP